jgi:nucleoside 2-deoxyribosyltransferase
MKIYCGHSKGFEYKNELYKPIRNSELNKSHEIIFPHETDEFKNSKDIIKNCDMMIAEVTYSATGLGIELGWAEMLNKPVLCVYKKGSKISRSLKAVTDKFIEYANPEDMIIKLTEFFNGL